MTLWKPGRRLFTVAAILMLLTALAHTLGTLSPWPDGPAERKLLAEMRGYVLTLGMGMNPSVFDIYRHLSFTMSITLAALGILNLVLAANPETTGALLRRAGRVNAVWVGVFLWLSYTFRLPPPLISAVLIEVFVLAALFVPSSREAAPGRPAGD